MASDQVSVAVVEAVEGTEVVEKASLEVDLQVEEAE